MLKEHSKQGKKGLNSIVYSSGRIGSIEVKNRLVRSATFENMGTVHGKVSDLLLSVYRELASGGVGLIITGIMGTYKHSITRGLVRIDDDRYLPGLEKIPETVKNADSECKIVAQLHHAGRQVSVHESDRSRAREYFPPALLSVLRNKQQTDRKPEEPYFVERTAPSAVFDALFQDTPRMLTLTEISEIIEAYAAAIGRAKEAGFDGVQLHAAHGYLLCSFLSPHTNKRDDKYGGSTENRTRIVREIYKKANEKVGKDYPILIKINTTDYFSDGTDIKEAVKVAEILSETGFCAIETSGCMWENVTLSENELGWKPFFLPESRINIFSRKQEAYFLEGAEAIKKKVKIPIMLVGGLRSFDLIEEILEKGSADFISLCRPLIRQPNLPNLWLSGKGPNKADCISCNACLPVGGNKIKCRSIKQ